MDAAGFIFDVVVVRLDIPQMEIEDTQLLTVDIIMNAIQIKLTSSRINVQDFRAGRSIEFEVNPDMLREDLAETPLRMTVSYNDEPIAAGEMAWPTSVLQKINSVMGVVDHIQECELKSGEETVGTLEILLRLQCKCFEVERGYPQCCDEIRNQLDKIIDPHDVLFLLGDAKRKSCCGNAVHECSDISLDGNNDRAVPTALDLSRYRSLNGRLVQNADILNTCGNVDCCELRNKSNQYKEVLNSLASCGTRDQPRTCCAKTHYQECPHEAKYSSDSGGDSSQSSTCGGICYADKHSEEDTLGGHKLIQVCPQEPVPYAMQTHYQRPRRCPVCKQNMEWLPKLAACTRCGYKPVPHVEEKPYNEALTAEEILKEYMEKCSSNTEQAADFCKANKEQCEQEQCRCTCKNGKVCPYCRVRNLCQDIFTPDPNRAKMGEECAECEVKSSDMYNVCRTSSNDARPHLARVFSELKELYEIKTVKRRNFEKNPKCEKALHGDKQAKSAKARKVGSARNKPGQSQTTSKSGEGSFRQPKIRNRKRKQRKGRREEGACDNVGDVCGKVMAEQKATKCRPKLYEYCKTMNTGNNTGHEKCLGGPKGRRNVPRNMGWLWSADDAVCRGWKPGAIRKPIKEIMKYFLKDYPADTIRVSQYGYRKQDKCAGKEEEETLEQKPTLHVCKKNDEYIITMRPLKDPEALKHCADPYLDMKPIQFKITKNPLLTEMRKLKRCLKDMGFSKCTCHKPVADCFCRSFIDKKHLTYHLNKECEKRQLPNCSENLVLSDSTDSDMEFDFGVTPPAGVIRPERLHKPNLVNHGTQYLEADWRVPPVFPRPSRYTKFFNCATGDRYTFNQKAGADDAGKGKDGKGKGKAKEFVCPVSKRKPPLAPAGRQVDEAKVQLKNSMKYLTSAQAKDAKGGDAASEKKKRLRALGEIPAPLLCMVDRRGKPPPQVPNYLCPC